MAAGKQGSAQVTVSYDDAPGGTLRAVTNHILNMGGVKIEQPQELSNAFGDAWQESTPSGVGLVPDITLDGFWDTSALGPHVVFLTPDADPNGGTRTLTIVFGDTKTFTVESRLMSYEVLGKNGNLTHFSAVIRPSGAPAWS